MLCSSKQELLGRRGYQLLPQTTQGEAKLDHPQSLRVISVCWNVPYFIIFTARQNTHHFASEEAEEKALIYNYKPIDTSKISSFEQCYFF